MSTPQDQVDRIQSIKKAACVAHLTAAGVPADKVRELLPKYAALDARRTKKYADLREALVPSK